MGDGCLRVPRCAGLASNSDRQCDPRFQKHRMTVPASSRNESEEIGRPLEGDFRTFLLDAASSLLPLSSSTKRKNMKRKDFWPRVNRKVANCLTVPPPKTPASQLAIRSPGCHRAWTAGPGTARNLWGCENRPSVWLSGETYSLS
jgi:hypothetical protein